MEFLYETHNMYIYHMPDRIPTLDETLGIYRGTSKKPGSFVGDFLSSWDKFSEKEQDILFGEISNWRHSKNPWKSILFEKLSQKFNDDIRHLRNLKYFLEHKLASLFINMKREYVTNALLIAAEKGDIESINLLLEKGADIDSDGLYKHTALMRAAKNGQTENSRSLN